MAGVFDNNNYFDVQAEYAKKTDNDILIKISVTNRSANAAPFHLLPTLWFRYVVSHQVVSLSNDSRSSEILGRGDANMKVVL